MVNSLSRVLPAVQGGFPLGTPLLVDSDQEGGGSTITASAIGNSRMFTARRFDEETGLYHYRARAYSPELRRFIQRDPLEYVDGPNAVGYVLAGPTTRVDPSGLYGLLDLVKDAANMAGEKILDTIGLAGAAIGDAATTIVTLGGNIGGSYKPGDLMRAVDKEADALHAKLSPGAQVVSDVVDIATAVAGVVEAKVALVAKK